MSSLAQLPHDEVPTRSRRVVINLDESPIRRGRLREDLEPLMVLLGAIYGWVFAAAVGVVAAIIILIG